MNKIYQITKGQLISLWVFGIIGTITSLDQASYSDFFTFLSIIIPAFLVFYTLGWKSYHSDKINEEKSSSLHYKNKLLHFSRKIKSFVLSNNGVFFKKIAPILIILAVIITVLFIFITKTNERSKEKQLTEEYNLATQKIEPLKEQVMNCMQPVLEKKLEEETRLCILKKQKTKDEFNACRRYDYRDSDAGCLLENDYESIDCSAESLTRSVRSKITDFDIPFECKELLEDYTNTNNIIQQYSKYKLDKIFNN